MAHQRATKHVLGGVAADSSVLSFDVVQSATALQKSRARANMDADILGGFRNKIINGDFDIWQRATTQTANGFGSDDRWANEVSGSTQVTSRQAFTPGQTDVPGNPKYFTRTVVTSVAGAAYYADKTQRIEGVQTLAGKTATVTFYAKADASKNIAIEIGQWFGSGGSPSSYVSIPCGLKALTTSWQKFSFTVAIPSIAGKTLGTAGDSLRLYFWFDAGSALASYASSLGQQSGTFDIAHVSLVEGDATLEADPFSPRHIQQELALCQRYYETGRGAIEANQTAGTIAAYSWTTYMQQKRAIPSVSVDTGATVTVQINGFQSYSATVGPAAEYNPGNYRADAEL